MTRAILIPFHAYTPFGTIYYQPILDFQLNTLRKYKNEFDTLYLIEDDNWKLPEQEEDWIKIIHVDSSKRYYDAYKEVLPQVKEDIVLFMDDDIVIYKKNIIDEHLSMLDPGSWSLEDGTPAPQLASDVVSITDTIGTMKVPLKTGNKLCPYFFAARKELLMKYLDIDWGPDAMPYTETFGLLTEALLKDGAKVFEMEDDKSNIILLEYGAIAEIPPDHKSKGFYHIRAGSSPAYLLATKAYGNRETYDDYLKNQPKTEMLRQLAWYHYICQWKSPSYEEDENGLWPMDSMVHDLGIKDGDWHQYLIKFREYHGL